MVVWRARGASLWLVELDPRGDLAHAALQLVFPRSVRPHASSVALFDRAGGRACGSSSGGDAGGGGLGLVACVLLEDLSVYRLAFHVAGGGGVGGGGALPPSALAAVAGAVGGAAAALAGSWSAGSLGANLASAVNPSGKHAHAIEGRVGIPVHAARHQLRQALPARLTNLARSLPLLLLRA